MRFNDPMPHNCSVPNKLNLIMGFIKEIDDQGYV